MRNDLERDCLIQLKNEGSFYSLVVSFGIFSQKGNGPYASPRNCFFKARESFVLKTNLDPSEDPLEIANRYLAKIQFVGNVGYDPTCSLETEEPHHIEVFMGTGAYVKTPGVAYSRDIGPCLGIGFYSHKKKRGSLFHIAGAEKSSIDELARVLDGEIKRIGNGLTVHFVSGRGAIDSESLAKISDARERVKELLFQYRQYFSDTATTLCDTVGEIIKYFSLDAKTGMYTVKKHTVPYEILVQIDRLASRRPNS